MSWRRLQNILNKSWRCLEDVLKTYDQDDNLVFIKTSSSRRMFIGLFGSGDLLIDVIFLCRKKKQATFNNTEYLSKSNLWNDINILITQHILINNQKNLSQWQYRCHHPDLYPLPFDKVPHLLSRRYQVHKGCLRARLQFLFVVLAIQDQRGTVFVIQNTECLYPHYHQ